MINCTFNYFASVTIVSCLNLLVNPLNKPSRRVLVF
jgi:hypothetical protein